MTKRKLVFFLFIVFSVMTFAQKVKVHAVNERLDEVLKKLKVEISFDNKALSKYKVTVDKTFDSPDKAIKYLLSQTSYNYQYIGGVYVISKNTAEKKKINVRFEILDVIPSMAVNLKEIIITTPSFRMNYEQSKTGNIAYMPAQTAKYIPGNADNSVFNLLRMMPGVRTAGEPSNELYVWGSSPGESRVVMDGIPLFAMQSFNNNISYINPYMAGEIRFNKGGLNVNEQSQIGAVAEISSNDNVIRKPTLKLALSTLTANVYGSLPLSKRFTLSAAYRHTLYNMFSNQIFNPERNHNGENVQYTTDSTAIDLVPSYSFQDLNLNLYGSLNKADKLKFAFYGVKDDFSYEGANDNVMQISGARNNKQLGSSAQYSKSWNDSSKMDVSAFYTYFKSNQSSHSLADNKQENSYISNQRVRQINGQITQYGIGKYRDLKVGGEMTYYGIVDSCTTSYVKPTLFASDSIRYKSLSIDAGIRADIIKEGFRPQPRISAKYNFSKRFSLSGTWGIYRQYLVKLISESASNKYYTLQWGINSQLKSYCAVLGANY